MPSHYSDAFEKFFYPMMQEYATKYAHCSSLSSDVKEDLRRIYNAKGDKTHDCEQIWHQLLQFYIIPKFEERVRSTASAVFRYVAEAEQPTNELASWIRDHKPQLCAANEVALKAIADQFSNNLLVKYDTTLKATVAGFINPGLQQGGHPGVDSKECLFLARSGISVWAPQEVPSKARALVDDLIRFRFRNEVERIANFVFEAHPERKAAEDKWLLANVRVGTRFGPTSNAMIEAAREHGRRLIAHYYPGLEAAIHEAATGINAQLLARGHAILEDTELIYLAKHEPAFVSTDQHTRTQAIREAVEEVTRHRRSVAVPQRQPGPGDSSQGAGHAAAAHRLLGPGVGRGQGPSSRAS